MKRLLSVGALVLLLAACGDDSGEAAACEQDYWDGELFATCLPADWTLVPAETLRLRGVPGDTMAAFQSEVPVSGQFPTVTLTKEILNQVVDAATYSEASIRSVTVLPGYEQVDERAIRINDDKLQLHIFKAQPVAEEPMRRFYQVSTVVNGVGYTLTGTTPVSVDLVTEDQVLLILRQASFAS